MPNKLFLFFFIALGFLQFTWSQTETDSIISNKDEKLILIRDTIVSRQIDPLAPSKAAFYSAILPGLGQAYNKKYWKIPIVYAAIGTGVYLYINNTNELNRYRDAYKSRLAGFNTDEFWGTDANGIPLAAPRIESDGLIRAQQTFRRNQELSLLVTIGLYALNIIDANVDAHLMQFNVDENLAVKPHYKYNQMDNTTDLGLTINFKF
ncbi:DUF5683 domain-containing protein [Paucihalobacter ruber]|uniref:DUF5683 domain-containing protein n=1 Tax=Paucihalobacter ruber TaxID=2567861 RepID=UPI001FEC5E47|nr:DUF5683 domain-containing protein [Paucihalobacter ruber]